MPIIDTHCHLNDERLSSEVERIVSDFSKDDVLSAICVGYDLQSSLKAAELAVQYDSLYCAVGIHPHDAKTACKDAYDYFFNAAKNPKCVAIGEIGLDYFYDLSPKDVQQRVFMEQLELADDLGLPVILHVRDAYEDTRRILFENRRYLNNGLVMHCYSGSAEYVAVFDKLDAYYSFGGAITFKNARRNLDSLKAVPSERLLLETDCPYMTPVPFRGKTNEPKLINLVADKAAEVLQADRQTLINTTTRNAKRLFSKLK